MKTRKTLDISHFRKLALVCVILLAGCASSPPATVRVEVPVMVPCVGELPPRPAYEFDKLPTTAVDGEIVLALVRDWTRGRKYEVALETVVAGCQ